MRQADLGGASPPSSKPPSLWDLVVRVSHWGIAVVVLANEALTRGGSAAHVWFGWVGLGLLGLRMIWGLVGSPAARFRAFPPDPRQAMAHLRDVLGGRPKAHASHNPAGALMVYALWAALAVLIGTGIAMSGPNPLATADREAAVNSNDWSDLGSGQAGEGGAAGEGGGRLVKTVHEAMANLLLLLISLHVAGVLVECVAMRRNLVTPMLFGDGRRDD